ncbi:MAG: GxxExxY protein [bacterium]
MESKINHEIHEKHENVLYRDECYEIQGAIFSVYREMGAGFLEAVYQECLEREFVLRNIPFTSQQELALIYKGVSLRQVYKPDFVCYGKIIIELKALKSLAQEHEAQLLNYLKATGMRVGMLVNFCSYPKATVKRMIL